jgi:uncharacterized protein
MRLDDQPGLDGKQQAGGAAKGQGAAPKKMSAAPKGGKPDAGGGAFADAFRRAGLNK